MEGWKNKSQILVLKFLSEMKIYLFLLKNFPQRFSTIKNFLHDLNVFYWFLKKAAINLIHLTHNSNPSSVRLPQNLQWEKAINVQIHGLKIKEFFYIHLSAKKGSLENQKRKPQKEIYWNYKACLPFPVFRGILANIFVIWNALNISFPIS